MMVCGYDIWGLPAVNIAIALVMGQLPNADMIFIGYI